VRGRRRGRCAVGRLETRRAARARAAAVSALFWLLEALAAGLGFALLTLAGTVIALLLFVALVAFVLYVIAPR
jgi:hypothetical protein